MKAHTIRVVAGLLLVLGRLVPGATTALAGEAAAEPALLDTASHWRLFHELKPPAVQYDDGVRLVKLAPDWLNTETPPPAANWTAPDFDDSVWTLAAARRSCRTPFLYKLCLRGKFNVPPPVQGKDLALAIDYCGGIIVTLNGKEVGRSHILPDAKGKGGLELAEPYPNEAYLTETNTLLVENGDYLRPGKKMSGVTEESKRRIKARVRSKEFSIPANLIKPGINVLAIELRTPAYPKLLCEKSTFEERAHCPAFPWNACELRKVQLAVAGAAKPAPAPRPSGLQAWNSDPLAGDFDADCGNPCEPLRPIGLVGARNGTFSGKVVLGSDKPIKGLQVAVADLKGEGPAQGGTIPAAAIKVRYGEAWGTESWTGGAGSLFGGLVDQPRSEYPLGKKPPVGAVVPVWFTVKVPKDAKAGVYAGTMTVQVAGEKPLPVGIRIQVSDWTLPDPQDYWTWAETVQVPDTLAVEYNLPLWSDPHWDMIAESFRLIADTGSRVVYVPAIAHTNLGNAESMIRWIKKGQGYEFDFSIMDQYLDLAQKNLGTPKIVCLQVWDIYLCSKESVGKRFSAEREQRTQIANGPLVTLPDPATGKTENITLPDFNAPGMKAVWQSLLAQVRQRLKQRGIEKTLMFGMFTDAVPPKEHVQFFHDLAPDIPWVHQGHGLYEKGKKLQGIAEVGYQVSVWGVQFAGGGAHSPPPKERMYGWKRDILVGDFERNTGMDTYPATRWRLLEEANITGMQRGIGRMGADYWQAVKDKQGRRADWVHSRFKEGVWSGGGINLNLCNPVLAPGPDGPMATNRLLVFAEGVQECEARTAIERALTDSALKAKLGADLAQRCQDRLDQRLQFLWLAMSNLQMWAGGFTAPAWRWEPGVAGHMWFIGSGWQDRNQLLFDLAGEVEKKVGKKK